jgi:xylitol oxidase
MDKREFLKASGGFVAASMISSAFAQQHPEPRTNWAGNYTFSTENLHMPASIDEVREVVKKCTHVRALGTRHSFNSIADSKENQVCL